MYTVILIRLGFERPNQNRQQASKQRYMGLKYLQELVNKEDIDDVLLELSNDRNGFAKFLEAERVSDDLIVLVVKLIAKICDVSFANSKLQVLKMVLESPFVYKLTKFIHEIVYQKPTEKSRNKLFWDNTNDFWTNIIKISKNVHDLLPTLAADIIIKILLALQINLPHIQKKHGIDISDNIKSSVDSLLDLVEKTSAELERKRDLKASGSTGEKLEEPPNDFREIPVVPTVQEVTTFKKPFYRPNIIDKPYESVSHSLDVQFRLLREDFVAPLREGICTYINNKKKNVREKIQNIRIYDRVRFLDIEILNEQNCYRLQFDLGKTKMMLNKYKTSRWFMYGSLVCFTNDNFKTILFGKIVQRDEELLREGMLIVSFSEDNLISFKSDYLRVESSVYFEPYYQVLNVLKTMQEENFPMEKYIVKVEKEANPPLYLLNEETPVLYKIGDTEFSPLDFPENAFYGLNESQLAAFKAALSQEFCIIQGPPGTGKTYLGLQITRTLLDNPHAWYSRTPILVICYTNAALDQFLEGLLPVTKKLLRIGNQSKNEQLNKYNLRNKAGRADPAVRQKYAEVKNYLEDIGSITERLKRIENNQDIPDFVVFTDTVPNFRLTWFYRQDPNVILKWLLGGRKASNMYREERAIEQIRTGLDNMQMGRNKEQQKVDKCIEGGDQSEDININEGLTDNREIEIDDLFDTPTLLYKVDFILVSLSTLKTDIKRCYDRLRDLDNKPTNYKKKLSEQQKIYYELSELNHQYEYIEYRLGQAAHFPKRHPRFTDLQKPHNMTSDDRWQLYYYWLYLYTDMLKREKNKLIQEFKTIYKVYCDLRDLDNTLTMKENLVVGMTTTGAARLQSSLKALKSPIVIVEEAAEVLEAHIVAAMTKSCKHLILIGDHQQLRPSTAFFKTEVHDKLGISMFERMVINKVQCHTLDVQHRMRPEIADLVCPTIYPNLKNHETTLQRPHILGIETDLYFIDHQQPELECGDSSKKNVHEATFLVSLARYLILNGYKPENITIIAAYLGQFYEMQHEKKKHVLLNDVRITVLDNYQGEECDIILLSLVRSNEEGNIGFLKCENRVCVALSRARNAMYVMGNMAQLCQSSEIWPKIRDTLSKQKAIGPHLTLCCQIHHTITHVTKSGDFSKVVEGGCELPCDTLMKCGHICKGICHPQDRDHLEYICHEDCTKNLCNDSSHKCKKTCSKKCGPCTYTVLRELKCGHSATIECHENPDLHKCTTLVSTKLQCSHVADKPCHENPLTFQCPHPCDTRVDSCGHACENLCHIRSDPDHLEYKCMKSCERARKGCRDPKNPDHKCGFVCFQDCEECEISIEKLRSCGHVNTVECKRDIEQAICRKPCKKTLPCGHKCQSKCFQECAPCVVQVEKIAPECSHTIKALCSRDPERWFCPGKCPRLLICGHICTRRCNERCTSTCKETVECEIQAPCGHYVKKIPCYLKNTTDKDILLKHCTEPCGQKLKCKDICSGTCGECLQGRIHKRCMQKCNRILVCNHECPLPCRQACKPCQKPCEYKCRHSKCKKKCGVPCTKCMEPCPRKCKHNKCKKKCGDYCSIPPCTQKCSRKISCGHPCVGFCGEPCPEYCKVCDTVKLQEEIFLFGTEEEEDAIFVQLNDCGHILESKGLECWLNENSNVVQAKQCPRCKTPILTTERFSDYIKKSIKDITNVKNKEFGSTQANENLREKLLKDLNNLIEPNKKLLDIFPKLNYAYEILTRRLQPTRKGRIQTVNKIALNAVKSKIQKIDCIVGCFKQFNKNIKNSQIPDSIVQTYFLLKIIMQEEDAITTQEIEDIDREINRLERIVQLELLKSADCYKSVLDTHSELQTSLDTIVRLINTKGKFTEDIDSQLQVMLEEFGSKVCREIKITRERREIVKAIGLTPGHWFKCPNGHYYAIGECGGAMQVGKCPDCGASVGGSHHRLLSDNRFAPEMDNASAPSWPGVHL